MTKLKKYDVVIYIGTELSARCFLVDLPNLASSTVFGISLLPLLYALNSLGVHLHPMSSLSNYLRTHRKRLALSQEEVAFLLGVKGMDKGIKVSRDENFKRKPSLEAALAYELIYGKPVRELFAGIYEEVEQAVAERAKVLGLRMDRKPNPKKRQLLAKLTSLLTA